MFMLGSGGSPWQGGIVTQLWSHQLGLFICHHFSGVTQELIAPVKDSQLILKITMRHSGRTSLPPRYCFQKPMSNAHQTPLRGAGFYPKLYDNVISNFLVFLLHQQRLPLPWVAKERQHWEGISASHTCRETQPLARIANWKLLIQGQ